MNRIMKSCMGASIKPDWFDSACATLDKLICYEAGVRFDLGGGKTINLTSARTAELASVVRAGYSALENSNELQQNLFRMSEDVSRHLYGICRRIKRLHKIITGEQSNVGCGSEAEYPNTHTGKALQHLSAARDAVSTITALIEEIEQQAWVIGADTQEDGVHTTGAMPLNVCPHRYDWEEILDQRMKERDAFMSRCNVAPFDNNSQ